MSEAAGAGAAKTRSRIQDMVGLLADLLELGMERGEFVRREQFLVAAGVLRMVNMPFILFQSGKLPDCVLHDPIVDGVVSATMLYLKKRDRHVLYLWWLESPAPQALD